MFIFKSNMDKDFDQTCEYILKLKRAELFFHGIKKQDKKKFNEFQTEEICEKQVHQNLRFFSSMM